MQTTTFTELRRRAKKYFDSVEQGETIKVTRRGRIIARIVPADSEVQPSWKKPALRLAVSGAEISKAILDERNEPEK